MGQRRLYEDGAGFCLSDHLGLMAHVDVHDVYKSRQGAFGFVARARRDQLVTLRDVAAQRELVEARHLERLGREEQELQRQRAAHRDAEQFRKAQQKQARSRTDRRQALLREAVGPTSLFAAGVSARPALGVEAPCAPSAVVIHGSDAVGRGGWELVKDLPLRGLRNLGNTCYVNSMVQVFLRIPAVVAWLLAHRRDCDRHAVCVLCALADTRLQVLGEPMQGFQPELARKRGLVAEGFADNQAHDAVEFVDTFLSQARQVEVSAGQYSAWRHVQCDVPVATHGDRLFRSVREVRRRCMVCGNGAVRSWFEAATVWRLVPECAEGGAATVSDMYLKSCGPQTDKMQCPVCLKSTEHASQARMLTMPNVLLFHVLRQPARG